MPALIVICVGLVCLAGCQKTESVWNNDYHTTPDFWETPRVFQIPADYPSDMWSSRISFNKHDDWVVGDREKVYSSNKAYWFQKGFSEQGTFQVVIYNEHRYITIDTISDDHYSKSVKWINEKLIYVRDWLGIRGGFDLIYDTEQEEILYFEQINSGVGPFVQWTNDRIKRQNQMQKTED